MPCGPSLTTTPVTAPAPALPDLPATGVDTHDLLYGAGTVALGLVLALVARRRPRGA